MSVCNPSGIVPRSAVENFILVQIILIILSFQVSGAEILSGGIIKLQVSEAEVNNINIRFLDRT